MTMHADPPSSDVIQVILRALSVKRLAHAYLILGADSDEKVQVMRNTAKAVLCKKLNTLTLSYCNTCISCKKIDSKNHPDFFEISPDGSFIKIEQIRQLQQAIKYPPLESKHRICLILMAERLQTTAANALLKTLEEPPEGTHFFLSAPSRGNLLPTIVSRCQVINFTPPVKKDPGIKALLMLQDKSFLDAVTEKDTHDMAQALLRFMVQQDLMDYFTCLELISRNRTRLKVFLTIFRFILRDLLFIKSKKNNKATINKLILLKDYEQDLIKLAQRLNYDTLKGLGGMLGETEILLAHNVNVDEILDMMMFHIYRTLG